MQKNIIVLTVAALLAAPLGQMPLGTALARANGSSTTLQQRQDWAAGRGGGKLRAIRDSRSPVLETKAPSTGKPSSIAKATTSADSSKGLKRHGIFRRILRGAGIAVLGTMLTYSALIPITATVNQFVEHKATTEVYTAGSAIDLGVAKEYVQGIVKGGGVEKPIVAKSDGTICNDSAPQGQNKQDSTVVKTPPRVAQKPPPARWRSTDRITLGDKVWTGVIDYFTYVPVTLGENLKKSRVAWHSDATADEILQSINANPQARNFYVIGHGMTGAFCAAGGKNLTVQMAERAGVDLRDGYFYQHTCGGGSSTQVLGSGFIKDATHSTQYGQVSGVGNYLSMWSRIFAARTPTATR
jgi:hypothetical protein